METGRNQSRKRLCLLHRVTYHTRTRTETTWNASGCCHRCRHAPRHLQAFSFQVPSIWLVLKKDSIKKKANNDCKGQQVTIKCMLLYVLQIVGFCCRFSPSSLLLTQWGVHHFWMLTVSLSSPLKTLSTTDSAVLSVDLLCSLIQGQATESPKGLAVSHQIQTDTC